MPSFNLNSPIPQQWESYVSQLPIGLEIVPGFQWDTEVYTSATTRSMAFFVNIQGKSLNRTSMKQPRQLPNPEAMLIQNIRIFYKTRPRSTDSGLAAGAVIPSTADDIIQLAQEGVVTLTIGEKKYGPYLPWLLPAANFYKGAITTGSDLAIMYGQIDGPLYPLFPNLMIAPLQQFEVNIDFPDAALTLSQEATSVVVVFDGQRSRAVQ